MPDHPRLELGPPLEDRRPTSTWSRRGSDPVDGGDVLVLVDSDQSDLAERLRAVLDTTRELVFVVDHSGGIVYANQSAWRHEELHHRGEVAGPLASLLLGVERTVVWDALEATGEWRGQRAVTRTDGSTMQLAISVHAGPTDEQTITVTALDVSEQLALSLALGHRSTHDSLTGLANRQHLLNSLDQALERRGSRLPRGILALIDVKSFRTVTDSMGHEVGDRVLRAFARRIIAAFPTDSLVVGVGGDEFAVYCADRHNIACMAADIERMAAAPFYLDDAEIHLSLVVGLADVAFADRPGDGEELLRRADTALHAAKAGGLGFQAYDTGLAESATGRMATEQALRAALRNDDLEVHYQPKVSLATGRIVGVEALLRWRLPDGTLRGPDTFLDVAEDTGLIVPVGRFVLEQACSLSTRLSTETPDSRLEIAVNLSVSELLDTGFVDFFEQTVARSGADPRNLALEVTENALIGDPAPIAFTLRALRASGARVGLDDFGTGYSSLHHLCELTVDILKVDRRFVAALGTSRGAIVRTVIQLAKSLRVECVAEGVETADQLAELRRLGCDAAQGYYFSRAVPEDQLIALLAEEPRW